MGIDYPPPVPPTTGKSTTRTLGDVLYTGDAKSLVPEKAWSALVESMRVGDYRALHALYQRAHQIVFTLIMRVTNDRQTAEELTLDTFHHLWRRAENYDPAVETVLGWTMREARLRAVERLRLERRTSRFNPFLDNPARVPVATDADDIFERATEMLRPELLSPSSSVWERLAHRITEETGEELCPLEWEVSEPEWAKVTPDISCKLLAADSERNRVSMLVRLGPGGSYPPHTHAGLEELHLLHGELWINGRKLYSGDYNRGDPGASDMCVQSATGCTCVLITSSRDVLL